MGETFDELAIDGSYLATHNPTDVGGSRRERAIDLNDDTGLDVFFAFDSSGSVGIDNFKHAKNFAKRLVETVGFKFAVTVLFAKVS